MPTSRRIVSRTMTNTSKMHVPVHAVSAFGGVSRLQSGPNLPAWQKQRGAPSDVSKAQEPPLQMNPLNDGHCTGHARGDMNSSSYLQVVSLISASISNWLDGFVGSATRAVSAQIK